MKFQLLKESFKTTERGGDTKLESATIMIVEDEAGIRELTSMYLNKKGYAVITVENGGQALEQLDEADPQLILLDIEMPEKNGFEVCQEIRKRRTVPIIFLSVRRSTCDKVKCFELGGDDYLTKPFDFAELEARIGANLRRYQTQQFEKELNRLQYGELEIDLNCYTCSLNGERKMLTAKEMELLIQLAKRPNQVWSHEQLYDRIWSLEATGNLDTVKVHIGSLRRKLERNPAKPERIKTARGFGYFFAN
ncbi:response regulator transcription factor [Paenibacillus chungangensis]|uniref:Response regulator transcription factor n=1 Tax=Paenibacillus chungangensis TaxID=696535 RepID=A0ABW3HV19_9BACL